MDAQQQVAILDDEPSIVQALARLLSAEGMHTRTWTSSREYLDAHDPAEPGCLLCDLYMPDISGFELQQILSTPPNCRPVILMSAQADIETAVRGMRAGAVSFLAKPVKRADLLATVREALTIDLQMRASLAKRAKIEARLRQLTPREAEVMELVITGMLNKQIAARLGTAEKTIKVHRGRLMEKMEVRSAAALAQLLVAGGLSPPTRNPEPAGSRPARVALI
jgi:FixJ family two-component response regulator